MDSHIIETIFSFMSPQDVVRCETVCKEWKNIARRKSLWKFLLRNWQSQDDYMKCNRFDVFEIMHSMQGIQNYEEYNEIERFITLAMTNPKVINFDKAGVNIAAKEGNLLAYMICSEFEDYSFRDKFGKTPLDTAIVYEQWDLAEYISIM